MRDRPGVGWVAGAAAALLLPKCMLCLAAYAMVALGLGRAGVELCGGTADDSFAPGGWFVGLYAAAIVFGIWIARKSRRRLS